MRQCDVLVVGGGPAGATAALALARAGLDVVVAEKDRFPRRKVCGEFISAPTWALLREIGVADALAPHAGPPVTRVGLFAGEHRVEAGMPGRDDTAWGRAVGRHILDSVLLDAARDAGAEVLQAACAKDMRSSDGRHNVRLACGPTDLRVAPRVVVDTHGSWLPAPFVKRQPKTERDLLGFKARFAGASLPRGLMPLVLFPGGYGGLVHTDSDEVSFSCCMRRRMLRRARPGFATAGEAVFAHVARHNRAFRETLGDATLSEPWLAAGPIRPGFRALHRDGVFAAGNAAGEAHPLVAEGIAMAIQSGWLLARHLASAPPELAARRYARDWRRHFARRIRAAQLFESLSALAPRAFVAAVRRVPSSLTWGARASGKVQPLAALEAA